MSTVHIMYVYTYTVYTVGIVYKFYICIHSVYICMYILHIGTIGLYTKCIKCIMYIRTYILYTLYCTFRLVDGRVRVYSLK